MQTTTHLPQVEHRPLAAVATVIATTTTAAATSEVVEVDVPRFLVKRFSLKPVEIVKAGVKGVNLAKATFTLTSAKKNRRRRRKIAKIFKDH